MQTGIVKWFDDKKGYGFITPDDGTSDVFVHYRAIQGEGRRSLREAQVVEFEAIDGPRGMAATTARPAK